MNKYFIFTLSTMLILLILVGCSKENRASKNIGTTSSIPKTNGIQSMSLKNIGTSGSIPKTNGIQSMTSKNIGTASKIPENKEALKNGFYKVSFDKADKHGWIGQIQIKISSNRIANVYFNYKSIVNGKIYTEDEKLEKLVYSATKLTPFEIVRRLEDNLVRTQDISKVDNITGATISSKDFINLASAAHENARNGRPLNAKIKYNR